MGYSTYVSGVVRWDKPFSDAHIAATDKLILNLRPNASAVPLPSDDHLPPHNLGNEGIDFFEIEFRSEINYLPEWIKWFIDNHLIPWGRTANGVLQCNGEDDYDFWSINVIDNIVTVEDWEIRPSGNRIPVVIGEQRAQEEGRVAEFDAFLRAERDKQKAAAEAQALRLTQGII